MQDRVNRNRLIDSRTVITGLAAFVVIAVVAWQAIAAYGVPDPTARNLSPAAVVLSTGVLVFREGLEAILVLAAVTAGLVRSQQEYWRAVAVGAALALTANGLFIGQSPRFFSVMRELAEAADEARMED